MIVNNNDLWPFPVEITDETQSSGVKPTSPLQPWPFPEQQEEERIFDILKDVVDKYR